MSWRDCPEPECHSDRGVVELVIDSRPRDLGGFTVRRLLPVAQRRMVGPFVFFDHLGPADLPPGKGLDVRPHPHIGLATVTYLFEGEIIHRDSLGVKQAIRPGAVNWMTAGRGIVHSERSSDEQRAVPTRLHGIQTWVALPHEHEETAPDFVHYEAEQLPDIAQPGVSLRLIAGEAFGHVSPVKTLSAMHYLHAQVTAGAELTLPAELGERGAYVVSGEFEAEGASHGEGTMLVFTDGLPARLRAVQSGVLMLFGGPPLDGPRHIWWNFVSSSRERIEQAKRDWKEERFPKVPGETEFIPLPD